MSMQIIINLLIKIFSLLIFGCFLKKVNLITDDLQKGLNQLLLKAILPVTILMSSQNKFTKELSGNMLLYTGIVAVFYILSILITILISKKVRLSEAGKHVFISMTVFANVGFIGFPVIGELYGFEGTLYTVIYNMIFQLLFFTYGVSLLSGNTQFKFSMIFKNPVTIASFACIVIFILQIEFQSGISSALSAIGNMTTPVSLLLIGCTLADADLKKILFDKYSLLVSLLRMIIFPGMVFIILTLLNLPDIVIGSCTLLSGLPAGSLNVIYAQQYDCETEFASRTVIQTMVLMVVTLPVLIIVINQVH